MLCSDITITLTHNIMTIESKLPSCETSGDYTTTTTAAPTPTPCTFIALPDADPTSCLGRVYHHRTKWVLPLQSENTALHGCVNRQSHHDSQHRTHRSMRMYQTPSQGQRVEAIVQTSSTHSVMSVGLVERPIPSALLTKPSTTAAPHTTILPETAARPVSMTMLAFLTTSLWDPRQILARPHCEERVRPHIRVGRVKIILPSRRFEHAFVATTLLPTLRSRSPCASWAPPLHRGLVRGSFPAPHHHDPNEMLPNFAFWVMVAAPSCRFSRCRRQCTARSSSSRSHRALEATPQPSCTFLFVILLRLATPALRLGVLADSWQRSESYLFLCRYGRRSGQPSSSSLARRACVHVLPFSSPGISVYGYSFSWSSPTGTP